MYIFFIFAIVGPTLNNSIEAGILSFLSIFIIFLKLGLTSFGGPVAHIGFFYREFVIKRQWLTDQKFAELVALCQVLPGPASSQVGMALGMQKLGHKGAIAAWLGFTLPSAVIMIAAAYGLVFLNQLSWLIIGLKILAALIVLHAIYKMAVKYCNDRRRIFLTLMIVVLVVSFQHSLIQILALLLGGFFGYFFLKDSINLPPIYKIPSPHHRPFLLIVFFIFLLGLPLIQQWNSSIYLEIIDRFFRVGSMVFGGGHVALPLLKNELLLTGAIQPQQFTVGYGIAQAIPGPLFTFSGYLGALMSANSSPILGGILALIAVFLPSYLLITGILPYWENLRQKPWLNHALNGIHSAVVGLLIAAFYDPIFKSLF